MTSALRVLGDGAVESVLLLLVCQDVEVVCQDVEVEVCQDVEVEVEVCQGVAVVIV